MCLGFLGVWDIEGFRSSRALRVLRVKGFRVSRGF